MTFARTAILKAAQSPWLRERAPRFGFVRRTVSRFMPGEDATDALAAARELANKGIATVLTHLGENITDRAEAEQVKQHYIDLTQRIFAAQLPTEISIKLTQVGLDLDPEFCYANVAAILERTPPDKTVWIDMEQSPYVDATLAIFRRARAAYANVGICVQAYLYRTEQDLDSLIPLRAAIRLVKGAYNEPAELAFPKKKDVRRELLPSRPAAFEPGKSQTWHSRRDCYARSRTNTKTERLGIRTRCAENGDRLPNALRHSARRAAAPRRCRLSLHGSRRLRHVLVSVVHASTRRAARERSLSRA